ncbi:MAG: ribosomal RNA small subunit methyltransferase A [Verrucomicrobia bacterium]|jgi:16S rRNA (adenine1518-N6/adenine1519-N6)-dimethyltransferase|nr:ribosomal RNA small subunit methyltransferase A [Verrucomicrobiota bacterium]
MALSPSQTRALLASLGHHPRKRLGQNFLIDGNIVRKSLRLAEIDEGETVVEIGPGLGTLTQALLKAGCLVHAVEVDPVLCAFLREHLEPECRHRLHLFEGDAVRHPRAGLPHRTESFKVVANLPYAITTPWLEAVLQPPLPSQMVLMMQKEAADRITAQPGGKTYGAISIFVAAAYEKAGVHNVARSCFYPVPGVDSILLHLRRRPEPVLFHPAARDLIRRLFTQRRKQIGSLLAKEASLQDWLDRLPEFGASRTSRPEGIPFEAWRELNRVMANQIRSSGSEP